MLLRWADGFAICGVGVWRIGFASMLLGERLEEIEAVSRGHGYDVVMGFSRALELICLSFCLGETCLAVREILLAT